MQVQEHNLGPYKLFQIPVLKDNYCYILCLKRTCLIIDPGESKPIMDFISMKSLAPTHIINTHHHWDHTDGNVKLKETYKIPVYGSAIDSSRIPGVTDFLKVGPNILGDIKFESLEAGGHTLGHVILYFGDINILFTGDVLFCGGCGRVTEGTHEQMFDSLQKIKSLPKHTKIFCGHEYSLQNLEFAKTIVKDPDLGLLERKWKSLRSKHLPTVPSILEDEMKWNPFLTANSPEEFKTRRTLKDTFRHQIRTT